MHTEHSNILLSSEEKFDENEIIINSINNTFFEGNNVYLLSKLPFILVIIDSIISHSRQFSAPVVLIVYIISDIFQVLHMCPVVNNRTRVCFY